MIGRYAKSTIKNHHFKLSNAFRHPYPNRTITGTSERQRTLAPSLTLARRHPPGLGKTPAQHSFLHPTTLPHPHLPKTHKKPPPPQLVAAKGVVSIYELDQKPGITQQPPCWAWGLRSRGCGYAPQYVPQPHPQAHHSPACCRGNGTKQRRAPHPHRQQSE